MNNLEEYYLWFKSIHLIAVISWMVGLLYMPRLFVYHTKAAIDSELDKTLKIMELKLFRIIMNPAMIATYIFGGILVSIYGLKNIGVWFHYKILLVLILTAFHGIMSKWRKDFLFGRNVHSDTFFRIINEIPAILMIVIIILVIVKPFE